MSSPTPAGSPTPERFISRGSARTVLVTGGAGFIGSHTCLELLQHGYDVVSVDDYSNSSPVALERVAELAGRPLAGVHTLDIADRDALDAVFRRHRIDAVIHFAARKAVGESTELPLEYHLSNVATTLRLLERMRAHGVKDLVFSSSCSIYGAGSSEHQKVPLAEDDPPAPANPYARTKLYCEQVLADVCAQDPDWRVIALRYFNPTGAHRSGRLGEDPRGVPNNLMPYLAQVAVGRRPHLNVFGGDWPTHDGTCVRDYLHVEDVADGHRVALEHLADQPVPHAGEHPDGRGLRVLNLGTGVGSSVLDLVRAFETACGRELPFRIVGRRAGDVPELIADPARVAKSWDWRTRYDLARMCADAWAFQQANRHGYEAPATVSAPGPTSSNRKVSG